MYASCTNLDMRSHQAQELETHQWLRTVKVALFFERALSDGSFSTWLDSATYGLSSLCSGRVAPQPRRSTSSTGDDVACAPLNGSVSNTLSGSCFTVEQFQYWKMQQGTYFYASSGRGFRKSLERTMIFGLQAHVKPPALTWYYLAFLFVGRNIHSFRLFLPSQRSWFECRLT